MGKSIMEMTREEFLAIEDFGEKALFDSFIIVPTDELHDSGYKCMRLILMQRGTIVGAVSGYSDALHLNGIGGFGLNYKVSMRTRQVPVINWTIDCLPTSGCLRVFCYNLCSMGGFIGSDAEIFDTGMYARGK